MRPIRNLPASVRQRLLNLSKKETRPFGEVLQYYAMERLLYRLACSQYADRFVLKGALLLTAWDSPSPRPTRDIDLEGFLDNDPEKLVDAFTEVIRTDVEPDGIFFDPSSVSATPIAEAAMYAGVRVRFRGQLDSSRINMQIDVGFGDVMYPEPTIRDFPTLLDLPTPTLRCYRPETAVAEKFEAMVSLGALNSRMKDFYDVLLISRHASFDGETLTEAIRRTLGHRGTSVPPRVEAFGQES